jgi:hypothetical protein
VQHLHQPRVQGQVGVVVAQRLGLAQRPGQVAPVDQVPGGQVVEHAAGHLAPVRAPVPQAQQRHDPRHAQALVKVGATHMHAARGQQVARAVAPALPAPRAQPHHGEVRRATANVGHQHRLLAVQPALVVQCCRDRLPQKLHLGPARLACRLAQRGLGQGVALGVVVHKMHRPAHHNALRHRAQGLLAALAQLAQKQRNDLHKAGRPAMDVGALLHQAAAQQAFQRAHQPALGARQVLRHGRAAKLHRAVFGLKKHRRGQRRRPVLQRHGARLPPRRAPGRRRVGRAKVHAQRAPTAAKGRFQRQISLQPSPMLREML